MTALIVIGIILAGLILHFSIGAVAALNLAPKVAEISNRPTSKTSSSDFITEYEWENNRQRSASEYKTQWLTNNWKPTDSKNHQWKATGRSRKVGRESEEITVMTFNPDYFKSTMTLIRWFWFFGVPAVLNASVDKKMIEKYDPEVAERKAIEQANRIKELEKELEIDND